MQANILFKISTALETLIFNYIYCRHALPLHKKFNNRKKLLKSLFPFSFPFLFLFFSFPFSFLFARIFSRRATFLFKPVRKGWNFLARYRKTEKTNTLKNFLKARIFVLFKSPGRIFTFFLRTANISYARYPPRFCVPEEIF